LAERLEKTAQANGWRDRASDLKQAWGKAFDSSEADNERTYICGLYPTWVVSDKVTFQKKLADRREMSHDDGDRVKDKPLWTYFNVAEAHQWLALGQPDKAWNDLRWFWDNQASPGLFTWWEGSGEENTFHRWEQARGRHTLRRIIGPPLRCCCFSSTYSLISTSPAANRRSSSAQASRRSGST